MNHGITSGQLDYRQLGAGMGDFIEKYIFPGGELLHVTQVLRETAAPRAWRWSTPRTCGRTMRARCGPGPTRSRRGCDEAREVLQRTPATRQNAERILRAYRLYLAGSAMSFEQGWIALHQMLATRPDGKVESGALRGAQSVYPFIRDYIYK